MRIALATALLLFACRGSGTAIADGSASTSTGETTSTGTTTTADTTSSAATTSAADTSTSTAAGSSDASSTSTTTGSDSSTTDSSSSSSETTGGVLPIPCPAGVLGPAVPSTIIGTTVGQVDELSGACGGNGAPDIAYEFTAEVAGRYAFDTFGSALDTILHVQDAVCDGEPLACNDDGIDDQSVVYVDVEASQTVIVVVDGFALAPDDFVLSVRPGDVECPRDAIDVVPAVVKDNTAIGFDEFDPACGSFDSRDLAYTFTAPSDGEYTFDTFGSSFDTILAVLDGACGGSELACNNNTPGSETGESGVLVPLGTDQTVTIVVEGVFGAIGDIQLAVGRKGGTCPDATIGGGLPLVVDDVVDAADNTAEASCGGAFGGDDLLDFTAPVDGFYTLSTAGSAFDTVLFVRDGGCNGAELACNDDVGFDDDASALALPLVADQSVIVGVDANGAGGEYSLAIDVVPCPGEALPDEIPQSVDGTTVGAANVRAGSCGGLAAPEVTFAFTAAIAGTYTFDTLGSSFDTVLYVRDGTACEGTELACNDDEGGLQSQVTVDLAADQTVTIVIDGYSTNFGNYTLGIDD